MMQTCWSCDCEGGTEHTTPGLSQEIEVVLDSEVGEEVFELGDKEGDGPEGAIGCLMAEVSRVAAA